MQLAYFTIVEPTRTAAIAAARALVGGDGFGGQAAAFLSSDEVAALGNFQFPPLIAVAINQAPSQPDPANDGPINFLVAFSQPVINFTAGDVTLSGTAGATTATITPVGADGTIYNVAVSGMTATGTVIASIPEGVVHGAFGQSQRCFVEQ